LDGGDVQGVSASILTVDPDGLGYTVTHSGIAVSGPGLLPGETVDAASKCSLPTSTQPTTCVTTLESKWQWGKDFVFTASKVSGTYRSADQDPNASPNASATHNITYTDFGSTSGIATTYGTNGYSVLTRIDALNFNTASTIGGVAEPSILVTCATPTICI
jgi:hypothetical protein